MSNCSSKDSGANTEEDGGGGGGGAAADDTEVVCVLCMCVFVLASVVRDNFVCYTIKNNKGGITHQTIA